MRTPLGSAHDIIPIDANSPESKDLFFFGVARKENGPPSFGIFDLENRSVSEVETNLSTRQTPATIPHLKDCGDRILANVQEAGDSGYLKNGELITFDKKTRVTKTEIPLDLLAFDSDMLSLEYDPHRDFVWITLPYLNRIEVWDLRRGKSVRHIAFRSDVSPTAVSFLSSLDLVVVTSRSRFFAFNARDASANAKFEENLPHSLLRNGHTTHTRLI